MTDKNKIDFNDPFNIVCVLVSCLINIFANHNHIKSNSKNGDSM